MLRFVTVTTTRIVRFALVLVGVVYLSYINDAIKPVLSGFARFAIVTLAVLGLYLIIAKGMENVPRIYRRVASYFANRPDGTRTKE